jgi:hypothetical protein
MAGHRVLGPRLCPCLAQWDSSHWQEFPKNKASGIPDPAPRDKRQLEVQQELGVGVGLLNIKESI